MSAREMANYPTLDLQDSIKDTPEQQPTPPRSIILLQSFSAAELACLHASLGNILRPGIISAK